MTIVAEIMSSDVTVIEPQQSLRVAAQLMKQLDVGSLPVCNGKRLLGMLTDRDITVRAVAEGLAPDSTCVSDVMTPEVEYCTDTQDTQDVMRQMGDKQLRRLPVVDADHDLVGIVSLADLATRQGGDLDPTIRAISGPGGPTPTRV